MTNKEINRRCAEMEGWRNVSFKQAGNYPMANEYYGEPDDDYNQDVDWHKANCKKDPRFAGGWCGYPTEYHREPIRDYCTDLNACYDAEKKLAPIEQVFYAHHLKNNVSAPAIIRATSLALLQVERLRDQHVNKTPLETSPSRTA